MDSNKLLQIISDLTERVSNLETSRIHQSDIPPGTIKLRHLDLNDISLSETFISSAVTSSMTIASGSFINFSPNLSITFTPKLDKKYIIFGNFPLYVNDVDETATLKIVDSLNNSTIEIQQESYVYTSPAGQDTKSTYVYTIATLKKGVEYTFTLQGKNSGSGAIISVVNIPSVYLIAQSL